MEDGAVTGENNVYAQSADRYGFGRYSIVVHAPAPIAAKVQRFRAAIGMAHMTTEPHVSIVSHLSGLTDRDELIARLHRAAAELSAVRVMFAAPLLRFGADGAAAGIVASSQLVAMRAAIVRQLPGVVSLSRPQRGFWWAHLTIYQSDDPAIRATAERLAPTLDLGPGFNAASLDLGGASWKPARRHTYDHRSDPPAALISMQYPRTAPSRKGPGSSSGARGFLLWVTPTGKSRRRVPHAMRDLCGTAPLAFSERRRRAQAPARGPGLTASFFGLPHRDIPDGESTFAAIDARLTPCPSACRPCAVPTGR